MFEKLKLKTTGSTKNLKLAGVFAYILIIANTVSGFLVAPYIMKSVGESIYGVYSTIASFSAVIGIVDIGITQTLIRYISNYNANKRSVADIGGLCRLGRYINYIIIILSAVVSIVLYSQISTLYGSNFSQFEISQAKIIFIGFAVSYFITLATNYYTGIISGYGYFLFINVSKCTRIVARIVLIFVLLPLINNIFTVLVIDILSSVALLATEIYYVKVKFRIPYRGKLPESNICKEMIVYTSFIFIATIVDQINNNLDNIYIGALVGATAVTVYSFGLSIFHMFQTLSSSISQMLIPHMSDKIAANATAAELEDDLVGIGRIQYVINGGVLFGFIAIGKEFVSIWLGDGFENVWLISIILMIGAIFPLIQNGAIAILKARNLMAFRTVMTVTAALVNGVLTYFLIKQYGYVYASVGTAAGFLLINTIVMDIYYWKKLGLNMLRVLFIIMRKITPINIAVMLVVKLLSTYLKTLTLGLLLSFLICFFVYVMLYGILLFFIELSSEKRDLIIKRLKGNG